MPAYLYYRDLSRLLPDIQSVGEIETEKLPQFSLHEQL